MSSVTLGAIGLCLFIVPIISIPVGAAGVVVGIAGILASYIGTSTSLRLSVAGTFLSAVALGVVWAIAGCTGGYFTPRTIFPSLIPNIERPYVPPPAKPRMAMPASQPSDK